MSRREDVLLWSLARHGVLLPALPTEETSIETVLYAADRTGGPVLTLLSIARDVAQILGVRIDDEAVVMARTVGDLVRAIPEYQRRVSSSEEADDDEREQTPDAVRGPGRAGPGIPSPRSAAGLRGVPARTSSPDRRGGGDVVRRP